MDRKAGCSLAAGTSQPPCKRRLSNNSADSTKHRQPCSCKTNDKTIRQAQHFEYDCNEPQIPELIEISDDDDGNNEAMQHVHVPIITHRKGTEESSTNENPSDATHDNNTRLQDFRTSGLQKALDKLLPGALDKSLTEVLDKSLAEAVGKSLAEALHKSLAEALGKSLMEALEESLTEALGKSLAEAFVKSLAEALDESIAEALDKLLAEALDKPLEEVLGKSLPEALGKSLPEALGKSLPEALSKSLLEALKKQKDTASSTDEEDESETDSNETIKLGDDDVTVEKSKQKNEIPTFELPPEYDPADSRWTLKHKKYSLELKELIPESGVYINASSFEYIKTLAKNASDLVRRLMPEIFCDPALRVCSLKGEARVSYPNIRRPGLDDNAVRTIIRFVDEYGAKKNWDKCGTNIHSVMTHRLCILHAQKKNTDSPRGKK
ncbi:uncharacterized protein LOC135116635 isoform X1 [Helicoverpa armigera]|uniref:uncharacterized protein LOC135116635 isoform X1 n=2 Tax=Helicoverpa armigera TaxID=29058 RepID=UPI003083B712